MPSAASPLTADISSIDPLTDIKQLAAEGYFQAIAYWLNQHLVPQKVYAQVLAGNRPGRLKILIEFEREPQLERLLRFVCDRLYKLHSEVISGAHLIARPLGAANATWEKTVRIPLASERQPKRVRPHKAKAPQTTTPVQTSQPIQTQTPALLHESAPAQAARRVVRNQFKFFRAALVTGTAAIALVFGGLTELVAAGKLLPLAQSPAFTRTEAETETETEAPWYTDEAATADLSSTAALSATNFPNKTANAEVTAVSFRPASRFQGRTVEAALETVAVVPHDDVIAAADPTVTLMFGGELGLKDFLFEDASSIDTLFSDIDVYQKADVAMLGLAEPLANASTSLQEDFYQRTRPEAVKMLKAGGIDIVSLASEGTMLYGFQGLSETLNTLDRQGIYRVGAGRNEQEAHRPEILEVKGQRIAYLGYNPDAIKGAKAEKPGVAIADSEDRQHIIEDIRAIRTQVDWVVVNYRWGETLDELATSAKPSAEPKTESEAAPGPSDKPEITTSQPSAWQRSLAYEAIDAGADLVVGYHPNHIQGGEIYHDRAIAYSLGDFVFDQSPLQDHDTAALRVSLRNQQMKVEFLPIVIRDSKLQMATGDRGAAILKTIRDASKNFEQPMRFPTVLRAKPNFKLPDALKAAPSDSAYPSAPNPSQQATPDPIIESQPATHPALRESEALFSPEPASEPALEAETKDRTVNNRLENAAENNDIELDHWGEKPAELEREFKPIPEGTIQRQPPDDLPEASQSDSRLDGALDTPLDNALNGDLDGASSLEYPSSTQPESLEAFEQEAPIVPDDSYPTAVDERAETEPGDREFVEGESVAPFIDPFLDPAYDSTESNTAADAAESARETDYQPDPPHPNSIEPYAEPLVGPISALPPDAIAPTETAALVPTATSAEVSPEGKYSPPKPKVFYD